jgi:hypothetical protein
MGDDAPTSVPPLATLGAEDWTGPSVCHVVDRHGSEQIRFTRQAVEDLLASGNFFWLDLKGSKTCVHTRKASLRDVRAHGIGERSRQEPVGPFLRELP